MKRLKMLRVRLSDEEWSALEEASGGDMSAWVREKIAGDDPLESLPVARSKPPKLPIGAVRQFEVNPVSSPPAKRCRFGADGCVRMGRPLCEACLENKEMGQ